MTRWVLTGCMALAALGAVTVLDVGSRTAEAAPSASPFAGSWSGTWAVFEDEVVVGTGTFDWTISDAGQLQGTVDSTAGDSGTIVGHVGMGGKLMMIGYAPADTPSNGFNGIAFQGTAVIDGDGKLVASIARTDSDRYLVAVLERN